MATQTKFCPVRITQSKSLANNEGGVYYRYPDSQVKEMKHEDLSILELKELIYSIDGFDKSELPKINSVCKILDENPTSVEEREKIALKSFQKGKPLTVIFHYGYGYLIFVKETDNGYVLHNITLDGSPEKVA